MSLKISPRVNQLWPPEGDNRVTNMDVVFFSDLEDGRTAPPAGKPGETWVQKGHPEVCWPQQWLPEDLGSNVRISEIRPVYFFRSTGVLDDTVEEAAFRQLGIVTEWSLDELCRKVFKDKDRQGCPLVFVGHGYGGWVLKLALVKLRDPSFFYKDLRSNLCGIVFYGGTNTKLRGLKDWLLDDPLLALSKRFERALDLKKVKVCVVNKNKSFLQEIKDYSDLERQLTDAMDSNEICTPTSNDDPSYLTLLEFFRQILSKALYQTIDDKKGQEVHLRLSETKDKEAWGDMEIASTSTRECRDEEMDEKRCVVQHVVGNVDQDHDVLTKEAQKLQTFLRQKIEMAQGQGGSTIFLNLHELHSKFLEDTSIFIGARKNVKKDSIEFLFLDAQCMSKVVGVGLHQALVTVTNDNDVEVEAKSESQWKRWLASMFLEVQDSVAFELIGFKMPKTEVDNIQTMSLPSAEQVAKQFGVGLKDFQGDHIVTMNRKEESNMFFPVILEVAEVYKALKEGDPHVTKRPSGVGSSTGVAGASSSGSSQQGKEEGKSVRSWSRSKPLPWVKRGRGDEKDDEGKPPGGDPPPDSGPSSEPERVPLPIFTVTVYLEAGKFHDVAEIPPQIRTASIMPTMTIEFSRDKTLSKSLCVTTQTQCNLGEDASQNDFGWFQDDIQISFKGASQECRGTRLKCSNAFDQNDNEGETMKDTTNYTSEESTSSAHLKSTGGSGQVLIVGSGGQAQHHEDTTETSGGRYSNTYTQERNGKQIGGFNIHNFEKDADVIYKFCIPESIKNPERLLRYRDSFTPKIVGTWWVSDLNNSETAPFTFRVERNLKSAEGNCGGVHLQAYGLVMCINLAMTHLNGLRSNKSIILEEENLEEPGVIRVIPYP